jgi:hypothetical protein
MICNEAAKIIQQMRTPINKKKQIFHSTNAYCWFHSQETEGEPRLAKKIWLIYKAVKIQVGEFTEFS